MVGLVWLCNCKSVSLEKSPDVGRDFLFLVGETFDGLLRGGVVLNQRQYRLTDGLTDLRLKGDNSEISSSRFDLVVDIDDFSESVNTDCRNIFHVDNHIDFRTTIVLQKRKNKVTKIAESH